MQAGTQSSLYPSSQLQDLLPGKARTSECLIRSSSNLLLTLSPGECRWETGASFCSTPRWRSYLKHCFLRILGHSTSLPKLLRGRVHTKRDKPTGYQAAEQQPPPPPRHLIQLSSRREAVPQRVAYHFPQPIFRALAWELCLGREAAHELNSSYSLPKQIGIPCSWEWRSSSFPNTPKNVGSCAESNWEDCRERPNCTLVTWGQLGRE